MQERASMAVSSLVKTEHILEASNALSKKWAHQWCLLSLKISESSDTGGTIPVKTSLE